MEVQKRTVPSGKPLRTDLLPNAGTDEFKVLCAPITLWYSFFYCRECRAVECTFSDLRISPTFKKYCVFFEKKRKFSKISPYVSNNNDKIGCRIPNHPIALKILKNLNRPIAAPSANISTKLSSTNIEHMDDKLKKNVFFINGGVCDFGLESTVISVSNNKPKILRYGSITEEEIKNIVSEINTNDFKNTKPLSPGLQNKHYSPNIPIRINVSEVANGEVLLNFGSNQLFSNTCELNLSPSSNLREAAKNFFDYLHKLDRNEYKGIAVAPIPNFGLGKTMNDRLKRASSK